MDLCSACTNEQTHVIKAVIFKVESTLISKPWTVDTSPVNFCDSSSFPLNSHCPLVVILSPQWKVTHTFDTESKLLQ